MKPELLLVCPLYDGTERRLDELYSVHRLWEAKDQVALLKDVRDRVRADPRLGDRLPIRVGLNTGEVVATRDASSGDFLITGDATNVAARLQQAAEPWAILASDRTVRAAANFEFGDELEVAAKGKSAPVVARSVVGPRGVNRTSDETCQPLDRAPAFMRHQPD